MNLGVLQLPEIEQPEEFFSFETYKNYLQSLKLYVTRRYGIPPACFAAMKATSTCQGILSGKHPGLPPGIKTDDIKKLLFNAWNTELVLVLPATISPDFVKYANHWSPVQAYYAVYLALQAYFRSSLEQTPKDHAATMNCVAEQIRSHNLFPPFWNVICEGAPTPQGAKYTDLPAGITIKQINPLTTPAANDFWDWYGMLLRTTRKRQFEKKLKEAGNQFRTKKGTRRKRFTPQHKAQVLATLRPTTLFDFLYRVRIRSNYEDADTFILGTMTTADAQEFNEALCLLTATTLFLLELHIAARLGSQEIRCTIDEFMQADTQGYSQKTIAFRRAFLL